MSESIAPQCGRCVVTAKQSAVKKYVVELSDAERERLSSLIHMGKHPARLLTRARILLKADTSRAGEGWSVTGSPRLWTPVRTRLPGPVSNWSRKVSRRC